MDLWVAATISWSGVLRFPQEPCQSPDAPQELVGWQKNEIIVLKDAQRVIQDLQWRDCMGLHLVDGPEHSVNFDSAGFSDSPQRVVACEQNAVIDFFGQHQRQAVVQRESCMLIKVPGRALDERAGDGAHIKAQFA